MSMCRVFSCVVGRGCLLWPVRSLGKTLLAFALAFIPRPNLLVTPGVFWLLTFAFQSPIMQRTSFLGISSKSSVGIHRTIQLHLLQHYWLGYRLRLPWYWMICLGKEQRSFCHFEITSKYCILKFFVDHDGYYISSKGFLPTVVNIMVIWVKFTHSSPF